MELKVTEKEDNKVEFKLKDESHGFSRLLVKTLQDMDEVKIVQYDVPHPDLEEPDFYLETKEKDPLEVLGKSCEEVKTQAQELEGQF